MSGVDPTRVARGVDRVLAKVRAIEAGLAGRGANQCEWREDADGIWWSECGHGFMFSDAGLPSDHEFKFCAYCSRPLAEAEYTEPAPETDGDESEASANG